ncbi:mitochondrial import receptor subunit TOM5 homolog [Tursiops truncatus]|uniref:Mitochondrial import receptor subunit TOM5 homolog n=2 Tax=Delphinidae TaxID=9726 RepID=A0A6J3RVR5_TURTR|nr:mitochondrial import receptor subunit TOM5 homolog [Tursiops truncatus]
MFCIESLETTLDKEREWKMLEDVISSLQNVLIYMVLLEVTCFIQKKLDSI